MDDKQDVWCIKHNKKNMVLFLEFDKGKYLTTNFINEDDINIMREKLIEDITEYVKVKIGYNKSLFSHMSYVIRDIINKRFGMDIDDKQG